MKTAWLAIAFSTMLLPACTFGQNEMVPGQGAGSEDPRAVLNQASHALQAVRTLSYFADADVVGADITRYPSSRGKVNLQKITSANGYFRLASEGTFTPAGSAKVKRFHAAFDGETLYKQSPGDSKVQLKDLAGVAQKDRLGVVTGFLGGANYDLLLPGFFSKEPLQAEQAASTVNYEGRAAVAGVLCDVIYVQYSGFRDGSVVRERWSLGREDHLPRRWESINIDDDGRFGESRTTLSNLRVNAPIPISIFKIAGGARSIAATQLKNTRPLLPVGSTAPAWSLDDTIGNAASLGSFRGQYVLLDFWATWCAPCVRSLPELQRLHNAHSNDGVQVFSINIQQTDSRAAIAYLRKKGYTFRAFLAGDKVAQEYGAETVPTSYVIGPNGRVLYSGLSLLDAEKAVPMGRDPAP